MSFHACRIAGLALVLVGVSFCMDSHAESQQPSFGAVLQSYPTSGFPDAANKTVKFTDFRLSSGTVPLAQDGQIYSGSTAAQSDWESTSEETPHAAVTSAPQYQEYSSGIQPVESVNGSLYNFEESVDFGSHGVPGDCGPGGAVIGGSYRGIGGRGLGRFLSDAGGACCNPRWFDIYVGLIALDRDLGANRVGFASDGIGTNNIVLSTDDLEFDTQPGLQLTVARLISAGRSIEGNYIGLVEWSADAVERSANNNLYSVFSDFGTKPGPPNAGFLDTDQAARQSLSYKSRFHSVDLILRQRYVSDRFRLNLSKSAGMRFVSLDEDFTYRSNAEQHFDPFSDPNNPVVRGPASLDYDIQVENDLLGFQLGCSADWCVSPRIRIGGEFRAGLYQNFAEQKTRITCTSCDDMVISERALVEEPSTVTELNVYTIYQISPRCKLRVGYYLLHLTQLAMAPDQFNDSPAFIFPPPPDRPRSPVIDNGTDLFLSGLTSGFEWIW